MSMFKDFTLKNIESFFNSLYSKLDQKIEVSFEEVSKILSYDNRTIGKIINIECKKGNKLMEIEDVPIYFPNENGYFLIDNEEKYTVWTAFVEGDENEINEDKALKELDLNKLIIMPGYYAILALVLSQNLSENSIIAMFNKISSTVGTKLMKVNLKNTKSTYYRIPIFFLADSSNDIIYHSNPRKFLYPREKVNKSFRNPHESHKYIFDLLETPESQQIGISLTLTKDAKYDFKNLRFLKGKSLLSYATSHLPFILHSDAPRMLMGAKNLKQTIKPSVTEEPYLKTGNELSDIGINAFVIYGLFNGYNYEDGIVISESFAEKMKVGIQEKYDDIKFLVISNSKVIYDETNPSKLLLYFYHSSANLETTIEWKVKQGSKLEYGDTIAEENIYWSDKNSNGRKKLYSKVISYKLRYPSIVEKIPKLNFMLKMNANTKVGDNYVKDLLKDFSKFKKVVNENYKDIPLLETFIELKVEKPCEVGDKLMGRYGNKGTVAKILPDNEMPKVVVNGKSRPSEMILSPMGVVSRMNLGQLYETHITMATIEGGLKGFEILDPLKRISKEERDKILNSLRKIGSDKFGRFEVKYKRNTWRLVAGYEYFVRLDHCSRDKLHVIGEVEESKLTHQPLKGKSRNGGQKFGEMEFWALYSHNAKKLIDIFAHKNLEPDSKNYDNLPERSLNTILSLKGIKILSDTKSSKVVDFNRHLTTNEREYLEKLIPNIDKDWEYVNAIIDSKIYSKEASEDLEEILILLKSKDVKEIHDIAYNFLKKYNLPLRETKISKKRIKERLEELVYTINVNMDDSADVKVFLDTLYDEFEIKPPKQKSIDDFLKELEDSLNELLDDDNWNKYTQSEIEKQLSNLSKKLNTKINYFPILFSSITPKREMMEYFARLNQSKRALESFFKKLFKKEGYIRTSILGRRLHYSGRAVITPAPDTDIDTVILPVEFGVKFIDRIPSFNKNSLKDYKEALRGDRKERKDLAEKLNVIYNNKYVLLNRQPTLHKHSIHSFKVRFWEHYTIGLPINVCGGFNADFDGDQMAVYFPPQENKEVKKELENMLPSHTPFKAGNAKSIYSLEQDIVYGAYLEHGKTKFKEVLKIESLSPQDIIKELKNKTVKYLSKATEKNLTLSIWEIESYNDEDSSMFKIKESKCRGSNTQYNQLYGEVSISNNGEKFKYSPFYFGLDSDDYFNTERGLVHRGRKNLMDKKLGVANAGYFTRELVEFLGSIVVSDKGDYVKIEYNKEFFTELFGKGYDEAKILKKFFNGRIGKVNDSKILNDLKDRLSNGESIVIKSPIPFLKENRFYVNKEYCGLNISNGREFKNGDYIGIMAGTSTGERGTQISMQTFHTGGENLEMSSIKSRIFKSMFRAKDFKDFLRKLLISKDAIGLEPFEKLDVSILYFELLFNLAQSVKNEFGIDSIEKYFRNFENRGILTCISFERGNDIIRNIPKNKESLELHPRVEYAFLGLKGGSKR